MAFDNNSSKTGLSDKVVSLQSVTRSFGDLKALDDVSLAIEPGEIQGLIGRSGAGKSTLIRCLIGLDRPQTGRILVGPDDITALSEVELQPVRRRIGMVFQHFNLLSAKTVSDNVALPLKIAGVVTEKRRKRVLELLDLVGLADKYNAYPAQLSGGQKQRVGIARALASEPILLLSDEATSALDPETTQQILDLLQHVNKSLGLSILLITHEIDVIRQIATRVAVLDNGHLVEEGSVAQIIAAPRHETTRSLLRTVRPSLPASLAATLHQTQGQDTLLRLDLFGPHARQPLLAWIADVAGKPARLLHGGISEVNGEPFGSLFVAVPTLKRPVLDAVAKRIRPFTINYEELGRVPRNA